MKIYSTRISRLLSIGSLLSMPINSIVWGSEAATIKELLVKAQQPLSVQYDFTYAILLNGAPYGSHNTGTMWQKGPFRKITVTGGVAGLNQFTMYSGPAGFTMCEESTGNCSQNAQFIYPLPLTDLLKKNPGMKTSVIGTDVIEGKPCTVIRASLDTPLPGAKVSKQCLQNDSGLALRIEETAAMAADQVTRLELHNVVQKSLPDSLFAAPSTKPLLQLNSVEITPRVIPANKPSQLKIVIRMEPSARQPESISVVEVNPGHALRILGSLKGDGSNVIEGQIPIKEKSARTMHIQLVMRLPQESQEIKSSIQDVFIQDEDAIEKMLRQLAKELEKGDIQAAQKRFAADGGKTLKLLQQLTPAKQKEMAEFFRGLKQKTVADGYAVCKGPMKTPHGKIDEEVMLGLDMEGQWVITNW